MRCANKKTTHGVVCNWRPRWTPRPRGVWVWADHRKVFRSPEPRARYLVHFSHGYTACWNRAYVCRGFAVCALCVSCVSCVVHLDFGISRPAHADWCFICEIRISRAEPEDGFEFSVCIVSRLLLLMQIQQAWRNFCLLCIRHACPGNMCRLIR